MRIVLERLFNKLTTSAQEFIDIDGYNTAEVKIEKTLLNVGIGINKSSSEIKIFYINNISELHNGEKFLEMSRFGFESHEKCWYFNSLENRVCSNIGNFWIIKELLQIASIIAEQITELEKDYIINR